MLYIHENNFIKKIHDNYNNHGSEIENFYNTVYRKMRNAVDLINFSLPNAFIIFATLMNDYDKTLDEFIHKCRIKSQSKLKSTFYEEISAYLFCKLPRILSKEFGIFNKNVCIGLKLNYANELVPETKDVDFCIGQEIELTINGAKTLKIVKPVVAIEVKTYTDATMFGEIQHSSQLLRSASPSAQTYVLMGYNAIGSEHMLTAKYIPVNQMFALRPNKDSPMQASAFEEYYNEISEFLNRYGTPSPIRALGKLIQ